MKPKRHWPMMPILCLATMLLAELAARSVEGTATVSVLLSEGTNAGLGSIVLAGAFVLLRMVAIWVAGPVLLVWLAFVSWDWFQRRRVGSDESERRVAN